MCKIRQHNNSNSKKQYQDNEDGRKEMGEEEPVHFNLCNVLSGDEGQDLVNKEKEGLLKQKKDGKRGAKAELQ